MPAGKSLDDWSYTNQPATSRLDRIRLLVGDIDDELQLIEDAAIEYRMSQSASSDEAVAALVCQDISARYLKYAVSKSAKGYSESLAGVSKAYAEKATELMRSSPSGIPSAPQLRFSTRRPFRTDTDLKQPQFAVGMLSEDTKAIDSQGVDEFGKTTGVE